MSGATATATALVTTAVPAISAEYFFVDNFLFAIHPIQLIYEETAIPLPAVSGLLCPAALDGDRRNAFTLC
jgi:hypothetical protein